MSTPAQSQIAELADTSRAERVRDTLLVVLFGLGLAFPTVAMWMGWGTAQGTSEKRALEDFPPLAPDPELRDEVVREGHAEWFAWVRALEGWPKRYEAWYNDHFAYRSELIQLHHRMYVELLGVSPRQDIVIGKQGWLFTNASDQEQAALDQVRGLFPFTEEQLREWQRFLEECRDWFEDRGVPFYFTVAPSKPSIHPEYLPAGIEVVNSVTRLDQLREWLAETPARDGYAGVPLIDLRAPLLEAKERYGSLYRRTDTHWNGLGALVAAGALVEALRPAFPTLPPIEPEQFTIERGEGAGGDLAAILNLSQTLRDEFVRTRSLEAIELTRQVEGMVPVRIPDIAADRVQNLALERQRPFRLIQEREDLPRLLMFRDSYGSNLVPFLARSFSSSAFYWQYRIHDPAIMALERPDVVVQEIGERVLMRNVGLPRNEEFMIRDLVPMRIFRASATRIDGTSAQESTSTTLDLSLEDLPVGQAALVRVAGEFPEGGHVRIRLVPPGEERTGWVLAERDVIAWRDVVYGRAERARAGQHLVIEVEAPRVRNLSAEVRAVPRREQGGQ